MNIKIIDKEFEHDFSIDKIDRREVRLHQLQSLMKSAANGGLEPKVSEWFDASNVPFTSARPAAANESFRCSFVQKPDLGFDQTKKCRQSWACV